MMVISSVVLMSDFAKRLKSNKLSTRAKVILTLEYVQQGHSLSVLLDTLLQAVEPRDRAFAHELTLGTLRQWWAMCRIHESLVQEPITDKAVLVALNSGLYQLLYLQTPDYASISQTVEAIKLLDKAYASGLINAILRKVATNPAKFLKKINKHHSLPNFLAKQLKQDWAEYYQELGQVLRTPAPIFVRANTAKISHKNYLTKLDDVGPMALHSQIIFDDKNTQECITNAIKVSDSRVQQLAGFADGEVVVQDVHAQLSGALIAAVMQQLKGPLNLLDACTAPAGKLTHWLAYLCNDDANTKTAFQLTAIDNDEMRLARVYENLQRLGFDGLLGNKLFVQNADATTFKNQQPFDVIMLDVPCSATGVIRRHPDIGLLRTAEDIERIVKLQAQILDNLWQSLAQGGYFLYITCSILKAENESQMLSFLQRHQDAHEITITGDWGIAQQVGRQCLPQFAGGDGFYYALLQKR